MGDLMDFIKAHPVPVAIGVVLLLVLISSRGGSTASPNANQAANIQGNLQMAGINAQIAGLNSAAGVQLGAQQVEKYKVGETAATARTTAALSAFTMFADIDSRSALADKANTLAVTQAAFAHADNTLSANNKLASDSKAIDASIRINADQLNTKIIMANNDNNFKLSAIGAQTQGDLTLLQQTGLNANSLEQIKGTSAERIARSTGDTAIKIQGMQLQSTETQLSKTLAERFAELGLNLGSATTNLGMTLDSQQKMQAATIAGTGALLPSVLQSQENIARINGNTAVSLVQAQNKAANTAANASAGSSWVSTIASVAGMVLAFL